MTFTPPKGTWGSTCFAAQMIRLSFASKVKPTILISSINRYSTSCHSFSILESPGLIVRGFPEWRCSPKNEWIVIPSISAAAIPVGASFRIICILFTIKKYLLRARMSCDFPVPPHPGVHMISCPLLRPRRVWCFIKSVWIRQKYLHEIGYHHQDGWWLSGKSMETQPLSINVFLSNAAIWKRWDIDEKQLWPKKICKFYVE